MFIFSLSPKKLFRKPIIISIIIFVVLIAIVIIFLTQKNSDMVNYEGGSYNVRAESVSEMTEFLKQFGWEVSSQPIDVSDIIIPSEFNDIYEQYNDIQKEQGLDLSNYKGTKCKKYSFKILNYPDNDNVNATLIVLNEKVIGGDISETVMDGFMKSFIGV